MKTSTAPTLAHLATDVRTEDFQRGAAAEYSVFSNVFFDLFFLKNPREYRFFTLKNNFKKRDLGDQKMSTVFCCFYKGWKARKNPFHIFG